MDFIAQFDIDLQYRRGTSHANADGLSRRPCDPPDQLCKQCRRPSELVGDPAGGPLSPSSAGRGVAGLALPGSSADQRGRLPDGPGNQRSHAVTTRKRAREERQGDKGPITPGASAPCELPVPPPPLCGDVGGTVSGGLSVPPPPGFRDIVAGDDEPPYCDGSEGDVGDGLFPPSSGPQGASDAVPGDSVPGQRSHAGQPGLASDGPQSDPATAGGSEFSGPWSYEQLAELQQADPNLGVVYRWVERLVPPSREELLPHSTEVKMYVMQWVSLEIRNGVLYRRFERATGGGHFCQLLAPWSVRNELLRMLHSEAAGHLGVKKTLDQVQRRAYWSSWKTDTELFCRRCAACCQYHRGRIPPRLGYLQNMRVGAPMERLQVDLCGPYVAAGSYTYVCTAICAFTKFVIAWPIRSKSAITVARGLVDRVFLPFGTPRLLLTDNGKEFENELCAELCRLLDIEKQKTTFYRPQCNGGIERWHSTMHSMLAKVIDVHQKDWHVRLPFVVAAYNSSVHETTKFTPNFLFLVESWGRRWT